MGGFFWADDSFVGDVEGAGDAAGDEAKGDADGDTAVGPEVGDVAEGAAGPAEHAEPKAREKARMIRISHGRFMGSSPA